MSEMYEIERNDLIVVMESVVGALPLTERGVQYPIEHMTEVVGKLGGTVVHDRDFRGWEKKPDGAFIIYDNLLAEDEAINVTLASVVMDLFLNGGFLTNPKHWGEKIEPGKKHKTELTDDIQIAARTFLMPESLFTTYLIIHKSERNENGRYTVNGGTIAKYFHVPELVAKERFEDIKNMIEHLGEAEYRESI